jgi:tRNA-modifying protein YgfZ
MIEPLPKESSFVFDFSDRAKFRVLGSDRVRFLNGQVTNDLRKATETSAIEACVLNAKGKIDAHLFISASANTYILDTDVALREALPARLDRYIIADAVEVEDISDEFGIFHLLNSEGPISPNKWRMVRARRFAQEGWDVWVKQSEIDQTRELLSKRSAICDISCTETLRIESGIPGWGRELTPEIIPIEANLEERCVDYSKGCYIGQEVISRIKMSGQTNKRLCGLVSLDGSPLIADARLTASEEQREVGWVTSADYNPRLQKHIGLGFVKRGFNAPGTALRALPPQNSPDLPMLRVEITPLPFL